MRRIRRRNPHAHDYWEGNWLEAHLHFREALRTLYERLHGKAKFETIEHWLTIDIEGDGTSRPCSAVDEPGIGNKLVFEIEFDQTDLRQILRDLDQICATFPILGRR